MLIHMDSAWSLELCSTYQQHFHAQDEIPFINLAGAQKHTKNGSSNQKNRMEPFFFVKIGPPIESAIDLVQWMWALNIRKTNQQISMKYDKIQLL